MSIVNLPSGYRQVEYIQSSGTQYVDTGFAPNQDTRCVLDAQRVAQAAANVLAGRKTIFGEYRADPSLDALDIVQVESKYAVNKIVITDIEFSTTGGSFRGKYTGRLLEF